MNSPPPRLQPRIPPAHCRPSRTPWALWGLALLGLAGCQNGDGIRHYQVPRPEARRLLAAVVPHGDDTWFFKLVGPEAAVEGHRDEFERFIRTVRFPAALSFRICGGRNRGAEIRAVSLAATD